jgi:putative ABC transport system permease protein
MQYHFYDERIDALYREEINFATVINMFTALTIFITCLGLFGLSLFISQQRTKEISVRKVLGASTGKILILISKEFFYLILIATIISIPISYLLMQGWLNNFAYKVSIDPIMIIISIIFGMIIALSAVLYQGIKAAFTNPAENLRYE